jgi:hypothetical protein
LLLFRSPQNRRSPALLGREGVSGLGAGCLGIERLFYLAVLIGYFSTGENDA